MTNEETISDFLRTAYTDERLAMLLAHAEDEKLSYHSCCCFIGTLTADHALRGKTTSEEVLPTFTPHLCVARELPNANDAEFAFYRLGLNGSMRERDAVRRGALIPLIKAEMKRREELKSPANSWDSVDTTEGVLVLK